MDPTWLFRPSTTDAVMRDAMTLMGGRVLQRATGGGNADAGTLAPAAFKSALAALAPGPRDACSALLRHLRTAVRAIDAHANDPTSDRLAKRNQRVFLAGKVAAACPLPDGRPFFHPRADGSSFFR